MALHIKLHPNERLVVNGCVLRNGDRPTKLEVENRADILRGNEILTASDCTSPAVRIQHSIQIALVSPESRKDLLPYIHENLSTLESDLAEDLAVHASRALAQVSRGEFYAAFKELDPLASFERSAGILPISSGLGNKEGEI